MRVKFTPEPLQPWHKLYYMGLEVVKDDPDVIFHWNYTGTLWEACTEECDCPIINLHTLTTRKSYVDSIFRHIYGYSSAAQGSFAVEKPEGTNGCKDCKLVNIEDSRQGYFYQMPFIDCELWEQSFDEYRITVMDYIPVICLIKRKRVSPKDLIGQVVQYQFCDVPDGMIEKFCKAYPMQYGELDCTFYDGRFYIFDVNPTPGDAAFNRMPKDQSEEYMDRYKTLLYEWLTSLS